MARSHIFPPDGLTAGELLYLEQQFSAREAEEREEWLGQTIKRLVRKGFPPKGLHEALMLGTVRWETRHTKTTRQSALRRNALIVRARKDLDRALTSLRRLLPDGFTPTDDELFELREKILTPTAVPPRRPRGRPLESKQVTDEALRQLGVGAADRRELMTAIGFIDDDEPATV